MKYALLYLFKYIAINETIRITMQGSGEEGRLIMNKEGNTSNDLVNALKKKQKEKRYPSYPLKRSKRKTSRFEQNLVAKYGITRHELDCILIQLCKQYDCQWSIVATVLAKQHNISVSQMCVRDRYSTHLDPKIIKQWYTPEQQIQLAKMFYLEGKSYQDLKDAFGDHGRGSLKKVMQSLVRRGLRKLQIYLSEQIEALPESQKLPKGIQRRCFTISGLCAQNTNYPTHKYSYLLFGYFVIQQGSQLDKIPKQLCMALYKRILQLSDLRKQQKEKQFSKIDPQIMKQTHQAFNLKMKQRTKAWRQRQRQKEKKMCNETTQDAILNNMMLQQPLNLLNQSVASNNQSFDFNLDNLMINNQNSSQALLDKNFALQLQKSLLGYDSDLINLSNYKRVKKSIIYEQNGRKRQPKDRKIDKVINHLRQTIDNQQKNFEYLLDGLMDQGSDNNNSNKQCELDELKIEDDLFNDLQLNDDFDENMVSLSQGLEFNQNIDDKEGNQWSGLYYSQVQTEQEEEYQ